MAVQTSKNLKKKLAHNIFYSFNIITSIALHTSNFLKDNEF